MGETDVVVAFHLANIASCDHELRSRSFTAMAGLGARGSAAVPALIEDLSSPRSDARRQAADALGDMGPAAAGATTALKAARDDSDAFVRDAVERALAKIDLPGSAGAIPLAAARQCVPAAFDATRVAEARKRIESPFSYYEPDQWCAAAALLAAQDPAWARAYLVTVVLNRGPLAAQYPMKHFCAAEALLAMGELDVAFEFHMANINGGNERLRQLSLFKVGGLGARASAAVPALVSELSKGELFSTVAAIDGLAQVGPGAAAAVPALRSRLNDPTAIIREAAARALRKIGA
jgi:HEAT repeat protein